MSGTKSLRDRGWLNQLAMIGFTVLVAALFVAGPADAQRRKEKEQKTEGRVLSTSVGKAIVAAQEALMAEPPDNRTAIDVLTTLLNNPKQKLSPYERAISLQIRGNANYAVGNIKGTIKDWEEAMATGAFNQSEIDALKPNVGQLYIAEGQYVKGATMLEDWLRGGGKANERIHMMVATAWLQADQYRKALPHAEAALRMAKPVKKKHFNTLNYIYHELKMHAKQASLLERQVSIWPDDKKVWRSIASLKQQANKSREAFEVNKIMYLNGMLNKERELLALAQYYSYYEVPYRGASILEREMNAGRVSKTKKNLELLANMWRQAREYDRAIPILTAAANISADGGLYEKLGEAYYSEEQYDKAEKAFRKALQKGVKKPGNAYILIANSLYERNRPRDAIKAFKKATQYPYSRRTANGWIKFINGEFAVAAAQAAFKSKVKLDECKNQLDRKNRMGAEFLEGVGEISQECQAILEKDAAREKAKRAARKNKGS
jgi:tetratricopeptide (TPR) repeat protein